jgi:hypothetical protein
VCCLNSILLYWPFKIQNDARTLWVATLATGVEMSALRIPSQVHRTLTLCFCRFLMLTIFYILTDEQRRRQKLVLDKPKTIAANNQFIQYYRI